MKINAEFNKRVVVHSASMDWVASPMAGVSRRPLDRVGDEVARATSIVRYDPGSQFSPHVHTGGEEFIVLEGIFQDEHGDFPEGSYIRNPPQSSHTPSSEAGCVIFVKLWQFRPEDRTHVRLNSHLMQAVPHRDRKGVSVIPLYKDDYEEVEIQHWDANIQVEIEVPDGVEMLVLDGSIAQESDTLVSGSWLRMPVNSTFMATAGENGAKVWMKRYHLVYVDEQIDMLPAE
ncbi:MAG: cupin domain-containing protein [Arenicella sp.]